MIAGTCQECGRQLADRDAPDGFCPACMLEGALRIGEDQPSRPSSADSRRQLGDYELLEEIDRGGMGVVFRAHQISLDRIVAVKLILFGPYAGEASVRRLQAEAAAAAQLRHPNIVAIHEAGEEQGQHFFSMDFVQGRNLAESARDTPLNARQSARLLQIIAEAIQYAHEKGIVHRDLKPSNILIDSAGAPRITDFGLAKRFDAAPGGGGNIDLTVSGQVLGSPCYVSPEQASGKRGQAGPRSDVYALGGILYFLLTQRPPFAADSITATLQQVLNEDPIPPRLLNPGLPGDIETICLKCLEKDPLKRYRTAQDLADELGRFLRTEPIHARPISAPEKLWRWCRRQPALASVVALLLVVAIGSPIAAIRINRERRAAEDARKQAEANAKIAAEEAARSRQVATFLQDMLKGVGAAAYGRDTTLLREILEQTRSRLKTDLVGQPEVEAALCSILGDVYGQLAEYAISAAMFEEALRLRKSVHGNEHPEIAQVLHDLAWVASGYGDFEKAEEMSREALRLRKKFHGDEHWSVAVMLSQLGHLLRAQSRIDEAERLHREALAMQRKLFGNDSLHVANALHQLASTLLDAGRCSEAETLGREAYSIRKRLHAKEHPDLVYALDTLGFALQCQDKFDEAADAFREELAIARKLYGQEHPVVASSLSHVAQEFSRRGQFAEAEAMLRESLAMRRKFLESDNPGLVHSLGPLAQECARQGDWAGAEKLYRECLAIREKKFPNDWNTSLTRCQLGACLVQQQNYAEAEPLLLSGYEGLKQRELRIPAGVRQSILTFPMWSLAALYEKTGRPAKAAEWQSRLPTPAPR